MKKLIISCFSFFISQSYILAQGIGIGTTTPHPSAILQINSTTKGLLIPSMTTAQRLTITSPANGLVVYDLSAGRLFYYQNGTWRFLLNNQYWAGSTTRSWVYNGSDSVGIGTAAPNERLHINGNIRATGSLKVSGDAGIGVTSPEQPLHVRTTASGEGVLIEAVNPIVQLRQSNTPATGYTNKGFMQLAGDDVRIGTNSGNTDGKFIIRTNGGDRVSVDRAGNMNLTGTVTSTTTGSAPLTPLCYGITADINTGGIARGTSNVTVTRTAVGRYLITCPGFTANTIIFTSPVATGVSIGVLYNGGNQYAVFVRRSDNGADIDQIFKFIAY